VVSAGSQANFNSDDYNEVKDLLEKNVAIRPSEVSILEGIGREIKVQYCR